MANREVDNGVPCELPVCDFRATGLASATFYCRHSRVRSPGNHVPAEVCQRCDARTLPCDSPRPITVDRTNWRPPSFLRQGWNAASSLAAFAKDRGRTVSEEDYQARISVCESCEMFANNRCLHCGCNLRLKAKGRVFDCPIGKWPRLIDAEDSNSQEIADDEQAG